VALAQGEREADRIFGEAGLQVAWQNRALSLLPDEENLCQGDWSVSHPGLRLLSGPNALSSQDSDFGFAVFPGLASVYYKDVASILAQNGAPSEIPIVLGCIIAHEVGHLLLGPKSHSSTGIMQAQWGLAQIHQAMVGTLLFTPEQSKILRAQAQMPMRGGRKLSLSLYFPSAKFLDGRLTRNNPRPVLGIGVVVPAKRGYR
jgi:hypothetical protein